MQLEFSGFSRDQENSVSGVIAVESEDFLRERYFEHGRGL